MKLQANLLHWIDPVEFARTRGQFSGREMRLERRNRCRRRSPRNERGTRNRSTSGWRLDQNAGNFEPHRSVFKPRTVDFNCRIFNWQCSFLIYWIQLNVITLGLKEAHNIDGMIALTKQILYLVIRLNEPWKL
jgi:hypothetical protein